MKKLAFLMAAACLHFSVIAQEKQEEKTGTPKDTIKVAAADSVKAHTDTIRIGSVTIITNRNHRDSLRQRHNDRKRKPKNVSTHWFTLDFGLNNYTDNTDYASLSAQQFAPGATKDWFKVRPGKSINVNIWLVTQQLNLVKHVINLKYAVGVELNNYDYKEEIRFNKNPTSVYKDQIIYRKNKLAADYVTLPMMLNFNFTPKSYEDKSIGFSIGMAAGYLYSSRQKYISDETGKEKTKDDFDLRPFKLSYVGELKLGPVKLYGSLATKSMFEKGLDQTPYTLGIRTEW